MSDERQRSADAGWWNVTGWQRCAVCSLRLDPEVVVHCVVCDEPLCPLCRAAAGSAAACACCATEAAAGEG